MISRTTKQLFLHLLVLWYLSIIIHCCFFLVCLSFCYIHTMQDFDILCVRPSLPFQNTFISETFFSLKTLSSQISSQLDLFVVSPETWRQFDGLAGSFRPRLWRFACVRGSQGMLCMPGPSFSSPEARFNDCSCLHRLICSLKQSDLFWQFVAKYNY